MLKTTTLFTPCDWVIEREERRRCIPRGEGLWSDRSTLHASPVKTFGRFSVRGPAAWRKDGGTGENSNTMHKACKALRYNLWLQWYVPSAKQSCERSEELRRCGDTQAGSLCYGWREMLCVVCEEPVRLTGYGREQHGDVRLVPDQVSTGVNQRPLGAGNLLRIGQLDEAAVIPDQIIRVQGREVFGMQQQVFFDLFSDDFRQNKSAYPGRTDRQHSFIEAPRRDDPSGEHVRIQKKPDSPTAGHFTRGLRREPRFTALVGL